MRIRSKAVILWLIATVLLAVVAIPPLFVFTLPKEMLLVHAMPDFGDSGPVISRLALFRISLWSECPVDLHAPNSVVGAAIAAYDGSSTNQKKVIRDVVVKLIEVGCSPNHYGEDGLTALMGAVLEGNPELVSMLLSLGADPLLRVKASNPGVPYFNQPRKTLGMTVIELAQWLRPRGLDEQKKMAVIIELLTHPIRQ